MQLRRQPPSHGAMAALVFALLIVQGCEAGRVRELLNQLSATTTGWYNRLEPIESTDELGFAMLAAAMTTSPSKEADAATQCAAVTPAVIEGPYFKSGAPWYAKKYCKASSSKTAAKAVALTVSGTLRDACTNKTVSGASQAAYLEVWQADNAGEYDNLGYNCRAKVPISSSGKYSYTTLVPAEYGMGGSCFRPAHIHTKVIAKGYTTLTTQMYFVGNKYNGAKDCGCGTACGSGNPLLQVKVSNKKATWNLRLQGTSGGK